MKATHMTAGVVFLTFAVLYSAYSRGNDAFTNHLAYSQIYVLKMPTIPWAQNDSVAEPAYPAAARLKRTDASSGLLEQKASIKNSTAAHSQTAPSSSGRKEGIHVLINNATATSFPEKSVSMPIEAKPAVLKDSDWPLSFPAPNFTAVNEANTSVGYSDYTCRFQKWMLKIANKAVMRR
jgi:hypothetical protein